MITSGVEFFKHPQTGCASNIMRKNEFQDYLSKKAREIDRRLNELLPSPKVPPPTLHRAMRHSVLAPGKRIRPILCLAACRAAGGEEKRALNSSCALEMIHAYSLIHDDLPAMDNDDLRRGRPACHKAFSEGTAILAGDALLTLAFEVIAGDEQLSPRQARNIIRELSRAAGWAGMVGGQEADLEAEGRDLHPEELTFIHARKTGALLTAAAVIGGRCAEAGVGRIEELRTYGKNIGLAFQIRDDILDVVGNEAAMGKALRKDKKSAKATYPALFGLKTARKKLEESIAAAIDSLADLGEAAEPLRLIAGFIKERTR